ncbi:LysE family transporter [Radiobacillus sp. PE A8.2]|uniref:LysE family transporter n=1 Tax=Radiobacillus sp. PE A8.2 TaxID=3380349 RepID=UPI00389080AD
MSHFISYVFLGLSLAAPIGPINAAQLDKGIKYGFLHAWLIGLGSVTADIIYMLTVYFGVVQLLEYPLIKSFLWSFGCFVLIYTGIESLTKSHSITTSSERSSKNTALRTYITGFLLSISNPLTILFWLGIYGSILAKTASEYGISQLSLYSCAIILGLLLWDVTMAIISSSFRKLLNNRILYGISVLSGISLIGFGCYFGYQAFTLLFLS